MGIQGKKKKSRSDGSSSLLRSGPFSACALIQSSQSLRLSKTALTECSSVSECLNPDDCSSLECSSLSECSSPDDCSSEVGMLYSMLCYTTSQRYMLESSCHRLKASGFVNYLPWTATGSYFNFTSFFSGTIVCLLHAAGLGSLFFIFGLFDFEVRV